MKLIAATLFFLVAIQFSQAKDLYDKALPMPIDTFIKNHYPEAKDLEWMKGHSHTYNVELYQIHFYINELLVTLEMTAEGLLLVKETEIAIKDVPKSFTYFIQQHKIKFIALVEYHDDKPVYVMESSYKGHSHFSIFSTNGKLLHTQKTFSLF